MKPEFMRLRRAIAGMVAALLLAAGIVVLSPAVSASAHHNTISVAASCVDNQWAITWTITNSEPDKSERITSSTDQAIIADGTQIAAGATYSNTETVSGPVQKSLQVSAVWSNGVKNTASKTIYPGDFKGICAPEDTPKLSADATGCVAYDASDGTVSFSLSGVNNPYTVELRQGAIIIQTATSSAGSGEFAGVAPGVYTVKAWTAQKSVETTEFTVFECAPNTPVIALLAAPCVTGGSLGAVTAKLSNLHSGVTYRLMLHSADSTVLEVKDHTATSASFETSFAKRGPGNYYATVSIGSGPVLASSATATITDCPPDLDTLAPPSIELTADSCDGAGSAGPAPLTAQMIDLDATKTYYVRVVDASGATAAGGADKTVSGVTTATATFPGVTTPGEYTAQLLIDPGKQLAATSPASAVQGMCLPTLAMTGPGALVPLGGVAALLLTLGGAVVTGRLRRRMAL